MCLSILNLALSSGVRSLMRAIAPSSASSACSSSAASRVRSLRMTTVRPLNSCDTFALVEAQSTHQILADSGFVGAFRHLTTEQHLKPAHRSLRTAGDHAFGRAERARPDESSRVVSIIGGTPLFKRDDVRIAAAVRRRFATGHRPGCPALSARGDLRMLAFEANSHPAILSTPLFRFVGCHREPGTREIACRSFDIQTRRDEIVDDRFGTLLRQLPDYSAHDRSCRCALRPECV